MWLSRSATDSSSVAAVPGVRGKASAVQHATDHDRTGPPKVGVGV